jgi:ketosteroid isomerase-like protein
MTPPRSVSTRYLDQRYWRGDVSGECGGRETDLRGAQPRYGVREYMASLHEDWETFHHEPEQFIDAGDKVVVFVRTCARGRASGADVELRVAHVLTFGGGKCLGYVSYRDREEARRLAGLEE